MVPSFDLKIHLVPAERLEGCYYKGKSNNTTAKWKINNNVAFRKELLFYSFEKPKAFIG